ncbi:MAG TPA: hypothetical protein P5121_16880 [Caldilineaceae bacterium]|nr:hypothetical protein [Caldilineaceae bacterium]
MRGSVWAAPAQAPQRVNPGCVDLVSGGDFEQPNQPAWVLQGVGRFPEYRSEQTFNNSAYAMFLGNGLELSNVESVSEARHVPISLPADAQSIILRFRYWPLIDGTPDDYDIQQADIFDAATEQLLDQPLLVRDNSQSWKLVDRDLTAYAGREISLRFRVRNNGLGARTLMYVDNVEIEYCPAAGTLTPTQLPTTFASSTPTATPTALVATTPTAVFATITATPTPTAIEFPVVTATGTAFVTPTPTIFYVPVTPALCAPLVVPTPDPSCVNILADSSFEGWSGWHFGEDPVPPVYVGAPVHSGARAIQLGNPPNQPTNVVTFSSVRQLVTLPYGITRAELRWWKQLHTEEIGTPSAQSDRQDLILLSPALQPVTILRRELCNSDWQEDVVDLTAYQGQSFYVYFNAYNDGNGGRTWMFLDDVQLNVCGGGWAVPGNQPVYGTDTPVAIPLTTAPTNTTAPLPTPSPFPTPLFQEVATVTALPTVTTTPPPTVTAIELPPATATINAPVDAAQLDLTLSPTSNAYGIPTLPPPVVVDTTTPTMSDSGSRVVTVAPPAMIGTPSRSVAQPLWRERLGPIAVLSIILLTIIIIIVVIVRTSSYNRGS